jgi:hypothetical protein
MDERTELPRDYVCATCGDLADVRSVVEEKDSRTARAVGLILTCSKSHQWRVPGKTLVNLVMDPRAEPLYDLADKRIAESKG